MSQLSFSIEGSGMWVAAAIALLTLLLMFYVALRQAASLERRLQEVLREEAQRLAQLQHRLIQLDVSEGSFPTSADASGETAAP